MTFFFDARAVAAKIQNQQATPANPAKLAKQDTKIDPRLADLAVLAAPISQIAKNEDERNPPISEPPRLDESPDKTDVGGRPVTWTGKIVSLDDWRNLTEWEKHGPDGRVWNGKTQQWEKANG